MNAKSDIVSEALSDQLSELNESVGTDSSDTAILADLRLQIGRLLSSGAAEQDVHQLLNERFGSGDLRPETFRLAKSILDQFSTENVATEPFKGDLDGPPLAMMPPASSKLRENDKLATTTLTTQGLIDTDATDERVQPGAVLKGRYLLKHRVSGGSMGVVFRAVDQKGSGAGNGTRLVAIKVLSPQLSKS